MAAKQNTVKRWRLAERVTNPGPYLNRGFISEKEMVDFIDGNAKMFAEDVLEIDYKTHYRENYLGETLLLRRAGGSPRVDFLFEAKNGSKIIVECKNPRNTYNELNNAIGQVLSYYCIAKKNGINVNRMCIVSSRNNHATINVIKEFKLPIELYLISRDNALMLLN